MSKQPSWTQVGVRCTRTAATMRTDDVATGSLDLCGLLAGLRTDSVSVSLPPFKVLLERRWTQTLDTAIGAARTLYESSRFTRAWVLLDAEPQQLTVFLRLIEPAPVQDGQLPVDRAAVQQLLAPPLRLLGVEVQGPRHFATGVEIELVLCRDRAPFCLAAADAPTRR